MDRRSFLTMCSVAVAGLIVPRTTRKCVSGGYYETLANRTFENVHFLTPITAETVKDCVFRRCTAETVLIKSWPGRDLTIDHCEFNQITCFESIIRFK